MNLKKETNRVRRILMRKMVRSKDISDFLPDVDLKNKVNIKNILICRPNHRLGNLLLVTPLIQEVIETIPQAKIDLFVKGSVAPTIFRNYPNINRIIQLPKKPFKDLFNYVKGWMIIKSNRYDIVINVVNHSSSGRISAQMANAKYRFHGDITDDIRVKYPDHTHMAKFPVYSFRNYLSKLGFLKSEKQVASLDLKLSPAELNEGKQLLNKLVDVEKRTISLFTYATGEKCYSTLWWDEFYQRLKVQYPNYNIVEILPVENVSQISFQAPSFYSKDIRQIGSVIANTEVFIGADSGMMHLASAAQTPTIGLFKANNLNTYAPYNNKSIGINTSDTNTEDCVKILNSILVAPNRLAVER